MPYLRLKYTKFDFGWGCGSAPDPAGEAHVQHSHRLAGFKESYFEEEKR